MTLLPIHLLYQHVSKPFFAMSRIQDKTSHTKSALNESND